MFIDANIDFYIVGALVQASPENGPHRQMFNASLKPWWWFIWICIIIFFFPIKACFYIKLRLLRCINIHIKFQNHFLFLHSVLKLLIYFNILIFLALQLTTLDNRYICKYTHTHTHMHIHVCFLWLKRRIWHWQ